MGDVSVVFMGNPCISNELTALARQQRIIDALLQDRFCAYPDYFSNELITALYQELLYHLRNNHLRAARIGKGTQRMRAKEIRGDSILWLNGASAAQRAYLTELDELRHLFNRQLFLGLAELETHFAYYPPGSGYRKHVDSFQNDNLRRISIVTYLNPSWREEDGGELELYIDEHNVSRIPPLGGTLVCFISEDVPHQVAVTRCGRASIAGWFRIRTLDVAPLPLE